jgi:sulfatase modifying factor 1
MGRNDGPDNERPRHRVRVEGFAMMACPVDRALYDEFCADTGHQRPPFWDKPYLAHAQQPATGVSWSDASAFALWLGARIGRELRLPTEAEREWAARGGRLDALFPWGDEVLEPPCGPLGEGPALLRATPPNGYGLYHMADGVHEWCADWYDAGWYAHSPVKNPTGPATGKRRAARGGSWRHAIRVTAVTARSSLPPDYRYEDFGFRLVTSSLP